MAWAVQHRAAQLTAGEIADAELRTPTLGDGAFLRERGQMSPPPGDIPVAVSLPLDVAVSFWLLLRPWRPSSSGLGCPFESRFCIAELIV